METMFESDSRHADERKRQEWLIRQKREARDRQRRAKHEHDADGKAGTNYSRASKTKWVCQGKKHLLQPEYMSGRSFHKVTTYLTATIRARSRYFILDSTETGSV